MSKPYIVAEVSKNWVDGRPLHADRPLLAEQFEQIIDVNLARGYVLHTFALHRQMTGPDAMNETIIAVFRYDAGL